MSAFSSIHGLRSRVVAGLAALGLAATFSLTSAQNVPREPAVIELSEGEFLRVTISSRSVVLHVTAPDSTIVIPHVDPEVARDELAAAYMELKQIDSDLVGAHESYLQALGAVRQDPENEKAKTGFLKAEQDLQDLEAARAGAIGAVMSGMANLTSENRAVGKIVEERYRSVQPALVALRDAQKRLAEAKEDRQLAEEDVHLDVDIEATEQGAGEEVWESYRAAEKKLEEADLAVLDAQNAVTARTRELDQAQRLAREASDFAAYAGATGRYNENRVRELEAKPDEELNPQERQELERRKKLSKYHRRVADISQRAGELRALRDRYDADPTSLSAAEQPIVRTGLDQKDLVTLVNERKRLEQLQSLQAADKLFRAGDYGQAMEDWMGDSSGGITGHNSLVSIREKDLQDYEGLLGVSGQQERWLYEAAIAAKGWRARQAEHEKSAQEATSTPDRKEYEGLAANAATKAAESEKKVEAEAARIEAEDKKLIAGIAEHPRSAGQLDGRLASIAVNRKFENSKHRAKLRPEPDYAESQRRYHEQHRAMSENQRTEALRRAEVIREIDHLRGTIKGVDGGKGLRRVLATERIKLREGTGSQEAVDLAAHTLAAAEAELDQKEMELAKRRRYAEQSLKGDLRALPRPWETDPEARKDQELFRYNELADLAQQQAHKDQQWKIREERLDKEDKRLSAAHEEARQAGYDSQASALYVQIQDVGALRRSLKNTATRQQNQLRDRYDQALTRNKEDKLGPVTQEELNDSLRMSGIDVKSFYQLPPGAGTAIEKSTDRLVTSAIVDNLSGKPLGGDFVANLVRSIPEVKAEWRPRDAAIATAGVAYGTAKFAAQEASELGKAAVVAGDALFESVNFYALENDDADTTSLDKINKASDQILTALSRPGETAEGLWEAGHKALVRQSQSPYASFHYGANMGPVVATAAFPEVAIPLASRGFRALASGARALRKQRRADLNGRELGTLDELTDQLTEADRLVARAATASPAEAATLRGSAAHLRREVVAGAAKRPRVAEVLDESHDFQRLAAVVDDPDFEDLSGALVTKKTLAPPPKPETQGLFLNGLPDELPFGSAVLGGPEEALRIAREAQKARRTAQVSRALEQAPAQAGENAAKAAADLIDRLPKTEAYLHLLEAATAKTRRELRSKLNGVKAAREGLEVSPAASTSAPGLAAQVEALKNVETTLANRLQFAELVESGARARRSRLADSGARPPAQSNVGTVLDETGVQNGDLSKAGAVAQPPSSNQGTNLVAHNRAHRVRIPDQTIEYVRGDAVGSRGRRLGQGKTASVYEVNSGRFDGTAYKSYDGLGYARATREDLINAWQDSTHGAEVLTKHGILHKRVLARGIENDTPFLIQEKLRLPENMDNIRVGDEIEITKLVSANGTLEQSQRDATLDLLDTLATKGIGAEDLHSDNIYLKKVGSDEWRAGILDTDRIAELGRVPSESTGHYLSILYNDVHFQNIWSQRRDRDRWGTGPLTLPVDSREVIRRLLLHKGYIRYDIARGEFVSGILDIESVRKKFPMPPTPNTGFIQDIPGVLDRSRPPKLRLLRSMPANSMGRPAIAA